MVQPPDPIGALVADPARAAILLDVDGSLAPIVPRPEDAAVPPETRAELRRLHHRYGLVACISGRSGPDAARVVGVPELNYVGEHGLELEPAAADWAGRISEFADGERWPAERKPLTLSFHFREATDESDARRELAGVEARAQALGLVARWGRMVLEVRPPVVADKGTAVATLLERFGLERALYAGDDTTDLDAFRALAGIELGVRVAVVSGEAPAALLDAADLRVDGIEGLRALLRTL